MVLSYRKNVDIVLNIVLENLQDNLLFVWVRFLIVIYMYVCVFS